MSNKSIKKFLSLALDEIDVGEKNVTLIGLMDMYTVFICTLLQTIVCFIKQTRSCQTGSLSLRKN